VMVSVGGDMNLVVVGAVDGRFPCSLPPLSFPLLKE
jgi:hypothetical protein